MTPKEFRELEDEILNSKRKEYASTSDRLENFRFVAKAEKRTPTKVALTYLMKHIQSIASQVTSGKYDWSVKTATGSEGLKQRIADAVNYLHLLAACIEEEEAPIPSAYINSSYITGGKLVE